MSLVLEIADRSHRLRFRDGSAVVEPLQILRSDLLNRFSWSAKPRTRSITIQDLAKRRWPRKTGLAMRCFDSGHLSLLVTGQLVWAECRMQDNVAEQIENLRARIGASPEAFTTV